MPRRRVPFLALAAVLALASGLGLRPAAGEPSTVFAAASLTDAMEAVGVAWRRETGRQVRFSFASSSVLARQIEAGAPAAIFVSANEAWMDRLAAAGLVVAESRRSPISNELVLVAPSDSPLEHVEVGPETELGELLGTDGRLAVGDPAHVPAGIYAAQALRALGLWGEVEHRLAQADDVRAALALVARGEAPLGIVYATDARISPEIRIVGRFPATSHAPVTYPFALVAGAADADSRALFDFLTGEAALGIYESFGFRRN